MSRTQSSAVRSGDNAVMNVATLSVNQTGVNSHLNSDLSNNNLNNNNNNLNGSVYGSQQQTERGDHGWTPEQSREYNNLISIQQQQLQQQQRKGSDLVSIPPKGYVEDRLERPTSAPPPPGFTGPDFQDRNCRSEEFIFGNVTHLRYHGADEDAFSGVTGDSDSTGRGFSLNNLVDVLGSGFNESIEDPSAVGIQHPADGLLRQRLADNPNLQRQTRHMASRLIGASAAGNFGVAPYVAPEAFPEHQRLFGQTAPLVAHIPQERGFPSSLSSPSRNTPPRQANADLAERKETVRRSTTPIQMHPGHSRGSYPLSKDIGMNVDEPNDGESPFSGKNLSSAVFTRRIDDVSHVTPSFDAGGEFYQSYPVSTVLSVQSKEFRPAGYSYQDSVDGSSTVSEPNTDISPHQCEAELDPFLWEFDGRPHSSRTIAILNAFLIKPLEVRAECEQFGALEFFRAEFAPKGIFFASYYDVRSADIAAAELQGRLQRISLLHGSSDDIIVRFCLPLNSSSQFDESRILIHGLAEEIDEASLMAMLRSYGAIRSCQYQGPGSFIVEFQNLHDAKQAILELESSSPWGPDVTVEVSPRSPSERRKGKELLSIVSLWRKGMNRQATPSNGMQIGGAEGQRYRDFRGGRDNLSRPPMGQPDPYVYNGYAGGRQHETVTQLIMGPDGRYTPVVVQNTIGLPPHNGQFAVDPRGQQIIHGPNGQIFISSVPSQHVFPSTSQGGYSPAMVGGSSYNEPNRRVGGGGTPSYSYSVVSDNISVHSGRSHGTHGTHGSTHVSLQSNHEDKDNRHLMLDLDAVENGRDTRTSLMVRNIPNKYTQQMLLSEFKENGHGPGVIDFFYLPIDFKNRCNRGYAFINFVNFHDILDFHRRYFGKQWRTFNSDKKCDITYARIQGKAAMLKRFENSALMDKDDEYKPLVFVSDGPDKGKRLPFADPVNKAV